MAYVDMYYANYMLEDAGEADVLDNMDALSVSDASATIKTTRADRPRPYRSNGPLYAGDACVVVE